MTDYRLPLFDDGMDDPDEPQPSMLSRGLDPGDAPLPSRRSPSLLAQRLTPPEPPAVVGTPSDALAAPQPLGGPGKLSSDLDAISEALGRGPALREVPDKPVVVKATEPIPVAVVNMPGAIPTAAAPTVITPSFGLGSGRPSVADAGATPALPTKVEVLDEAGLAQLVKSVGQQVADAMVNQGVVRTRRTAPVEGASEGSAETPYAMPEMEIAPPPAARAYQPPSEAALPAEHALPTVETVEEKPAKPTWATALTHGMKALTGESLVGGAAELYVAQQAANVAASAISIPGQAARAGGQVAASAVGNDYMGAFNKAVDAASDTLGKIPVVGAPLSAALQTAVAPVRAFTDVVQAFVDRGKELSQYSGPLAGEQARVQVRDLMADLREAQELGPGMAALQDKQDQVWVELREILLPIKSAMIDMLIPIMDFIKNQQDGLKALLGATKDDDVTWKKRLELLFEGPIGAWMARMDENTKKDMKAKDARETLFQVLDGVPSPGQMLPPLGPFPNPQPHFPGQ